MRINDVYRPTDKFDLGYVDTFYNELFMPLRDKVTNLLEIGIHYGESLLLWRDYFPNAVIHGVDVHEYTPSLRQEERLNLQYTNAYTKEFTNTLSDEFFDIIIDDGPHTFESMVFFLQHYMNKLKPGGILVLEDIINKNWTPHLIDIVNTNYTNYITIFDMRNRIPDPVLNEKWKTGLDVIVLQKRF
jgi:trans-aconitate methyltransferase